MGMDQDNGTMKGHEMDSLPDQDNSSGMGHSGIDKGSSQNRGN